METQSNKPPGRKAEKGVISLYADRLVLDAVAGEAEARMWSLAQTAAFFLKKGLQAEGVEIKETSHQVKGKQ